MPNVNVTIRMDKELKAQAEDLFSDFGLSITSAFTMFAKQALREQRIPFEVSRTPNETTLAAFEEVAQMKANPSAYKSYTNMNDLMGDLLQ